MKNYISPSIMCADLLNLEREIKQCEKAKVDFIHYDVMDTTFVSQTMLPLLAIPRFKEVTDIPLDIHVMIDKPERIIDTILPHSRDSFVSFHVEATHEIGSLIQSIRKAGGKPGVALNSGTSLSFLEEVIDHIDMITVILGNAGFGPRQPLDNQLLNKVKRISEMIKKSGRDIILSVDGGVSFDVGKETSKVGANAFVLGTSAVYQEGKDFVEQVEKFRAVLSSVHE